MYLDTRVWTNKTRVAKGCQLKNSCLGSDTTVRYSLFSRMSPSLSLPYHSSLSPKEYDDSHVLALVLLFDKIGSCGSRIKASSRERCHVCGRERRDGRERTTATKVTRFFQAFQGIYNYRRRHFFPILCFAFHFAKVSNHYC